MDLHFKQVFLDRWHTYFPDVELPITFHYADAAPAENQAPAAQRHRCFVCDLNRVRRGASRYFDVDAISCGGGRRYLGFDPDLRPNFEYFLSCGIPGEMEGERYKKSPELVRDILERQPVFEAPGRYIAFKRWDKLDESDEPLVVIFFARPDALSGLFTLANYDEVETGIIAPFSAGCASIVQYPYQQLQTARPKSVLGMFDVSARPCVEPEVLTLAVPWPKFVRMVNDMDESFLITESWRKVRARIARQARASE